MSTAPARAAGPAEVPHWDDFGACPCGGVFQYNAGQAVMPKGLTGRHPARALLVQCRTCLGAEARRPRPYRSRRPNLPSGHVYYRLTVAPDLDCGCGVPLACYGLGIERGSIFHACESCGSIQVRVEGEPQYRLVPETDLGRRSTGPADTGRTANR
jgi:hypothetical protein